ncbi:MAG: prolipoprotein diacylglyceryl transferase [Clostridia bacterium]|nr:prolipoprotein diacylglyceryl transferase [Clostridia bacterium]
MYPYPVLFDKIGLYEIFLTIGVLSAFFIADRLAVKRGFSLALQRFFVVAIPLAIAVGFLGAVLFQAFYDFMQTGTFVVNNSTGMTFYGGLIFGVLAFLLVWFVGALPFKLGKESRRRFADVADIAACVIPLAHAFGRIGCFFAGCCHGLPTDSIFGVKMHTAQGLQSVLPVQLYEAAFLFLLSGATFFLFFKAKGKAKNVPLLSVYAVAYGVWRFFIEYLRGDDRGATVVSFLSPSQLTALILMAAGVVYYCILFFYKRKNTEKTE